MKKVFLVVIKIMKAATGAKDIEAPVSNANTDDTLSPGVSHFN